MNTNLPKSADKKAHKSVDNKYIYGFTAPTRFGFHRCLWVCLPLELNVIREENQEGRHMGKLNSKCRIFLIQKFLRLIVLHISYFE